MIMLGWAGAGAVFGGGGGFNWHALIVQALGFAILVAVLARFVAPVLKKMLGDRSKSIEDRFTQLDKDVAESSRQMSEYQDRLSKIDVELRRRIQAAQDEGA